jgi:hypothetical protein
MRSVEERFWSHVDIRSANECWPWLAAKRKSGHGVFLWAPHRLTPASRFAYILTHGAISDTMTVQHLCHNHPCCNPAHLQLLSLADKLRMVRVNGKGSPELNSRKTHCPRGHEYTPDNTYLDPADGSRQCRRCRELAHYRHRIHQRLNGLTANGTPFKNSPEPLMKHRRPSVISHDPQPP